MIIKDNFKSLLRYLEFEEKGNIFSKNFKGNGVFLKVDFKKEQIEYPEIAGLIINERQTCNFSQAENAVVFECVYKLLEKGYEPKHIELEPKWKVGHGASGGRADILVYNQQDKPLLIIECKTFGKEFQDAWKETLADGGQLFSYAQQISATEFLCLYASEFDKKENFLSVEQRIISHTDNKEILKQDDKLQSFKKASNVKKRFEVWKDTYQLEYTRTGIFEQNIQKYNIGKSKYTLEIDTRPISHKDKEGKYHEFRTILRKFNIQRRENAFEVLVNLFLCKIVDEEENKTNLKFYWKGIAYDNYFDFVDRLQNLYQIGMKKFLDDEITYVSNEEIDNAFWTVKNKRNSTKKEIQKQFRRLKFFTNDAFAFLRVENEKKFNKNVKVLVEIVQMWQNLRLKTKEQNQFLGDMFEFFLDNSIKQSEGQFFTPIPITKFIVMSLPLEDKIKNASEPLRAIDYACGAGHFLTEYAHQIKPFVEKYKETELSKYYENIIGIEKEDRLAKVAKVSAYMYGQDQIKILEEDALSNIAEIKQENFDILIANPPFAVEGFLQNLEDKEQEQYQLIETTKLNSNTSNIQCFFIERAKQLMSPGGTVGIIVPSSVLSNTDNTHVVTREIILKYFDIISIVELGSGTFGKTGTNTNVLFLRRKTQKPEPAEHYKNRVEDYFEGIKEGDKDLAEYQDLYLIRKYCEHTELPYEEYKKLLGITVDTFYLLEHLLKTEIFKDYKANFAKSADIKNLNTKTFFKKKTKEEKQTELDKRFIKYIYAIEKDKLFYFMLAHENKQKVLLVKSPNDNKEQKKFLGYQWSGSKGSEGIKYNGGDTINDIITPLFDPTQANNAEKINYFIQQNFVGKQHKNLPEFCSYVSVASLLDFSQKTFDKKINLSGDKVYFAIESKYPYFKIDKLLVKINGEITKIENNAIKEKGKYPVITQETSKTISGYTDINKPITDLPLIVFGDHSFTFKYIDYEFVRGADGTQLLKFTDDIIPKYFYQLTEAIYLNDAKYERNFKYLKELKIPKPPKEIQQKIISECENVDKNVEEANNTVRNSKKEIEKVIKGEYKKGYNLETVEKLKMQVTGNLTKISQNEILSQGKYPVITQETDKIISGYTDNKDFISDLPLIIFGDHSCSFKFVDFPFVRGADGTQLIKVDNIKILPKYFYFIIIHAKITNKGKYERHFKYLKTIKIPLPTIQEQKKIVSAIEKLENKINSAKKVIENASDEKRTIMTKYL